MTWLMIGGYFLLVAVALFGILWPRRAHSARETTAEPNADWWEELRKLQSDQRQLALEWENTYDKIRRAMAKVGKRQAAVDKEEEENGAAAGDLNDPRVRGKLLAEARRRFNH